MKQIASRSMKQIVSFSATHIKQRYLHCKPSAHTDPHSLSQQMKQYDTVTVWKQGKIEVSCLKHFFFFKSRPPSVIPLCK